MDKTLPWKIQFQILAPAIPMPHPDTAHIEIPSIFPLVACTIRAVTRSMKEFSYSPCGLNLQVASPCSANAQTAPDEPWPKSQREAGGIDDTGSGENSMNPMVNRYPGQF
jgi:hypothetical protein